MRMVAWRSGIFLTAPSLVRGSICLRARLSCCVRPWAGAPVLRSHGSRAGHVNDRANDHVPQLTAGRLSNSRSASTLFACREPDVLDDHKQVARVRWRRNKPEMPIERDSPVVLGVNGKRAHAYHV
jgi:hypothetical protein